MCRPPSNLLSFTRGVDYEVCHTRGTIEIATLPSYYSGRVVGIIRNGEPGFEARHNVDGCIRGTLWASIRIIALFTVPLLVHRLESVMPVSEGGMRMQIPSNIAP